MNRLEFITGLLVDRVRSAATEPKDVFDAMVKALESCSDEDHVVVLNTHAPYVLHVSGYIKGVRSCVNRVMRQFKNDFDWHVRPDPVSKLLATITITPKLNAMYDVLINRNGEANFVSGPYRGRQVVWSRRTVSAKPRSGTCCAKPDIWNGAFYGWIPVDENHF